MTSRIPPSRSGTAHFRSAVFVRVSNVTRRKSRPDTRLPYRKEGYPRNTGPGAIASVEGRRPQWVQHTTRSQGVRQQDSHQPTATRCNAPGSFCRLQILQLGDSFGVTYLRHKGSIQQDYWTYKGGHVVLQRQGIAEGNGIGRFSEERRCSSGR